MRTMLPSTQLHRRLSLRHLLRFLSTSTSDPIPTPTPIEHKRAKPPKPVTPVTPPPLTKTAIRAHIQRETDPDRALSLLSSLSSLSSSVSSSSYKFSVDNVARCFSLSSRFDDAAKLLDSRIPDAISESDFAFLLASYGRASIPDRGLSAFKARIADSSLTVSVLSFNALLSAFCQSGYYDQVPHLFTSLSEEYHISPDAVSYLILIKSLGRSGKIEDALVTLRLMKEEKGISPTPAIYSTVLSSLYKLDKLEEAELLWNDMVETGCKPDHAIYNAKIWYHANRAETDKVLELIKEMETAGVKPNTFTYNFLMMCHFKNEHWEVAKTVYKQMLAKKACAPNGATFRILLDGFSQSRDFKTGLRVFFESLKKNKMPDLTSVRTFVEGLVKDGKEDQAKTVAAQVRKIVPAKSTDFWKQVEKDLGSS